MAKITDEGWQTSVADAPQPIAIVYGANIKCPAVPCQPRRLPRRPASATDRAPWPKL